MDKLDKYFDTSKEAVAHVRDREARKKIFAEELKQYNYTVDEFVNQFGEDTHPSKDWTVDSLVAPNFIEYCLNVPYFDNSFMAVQFEEFFDEYYAKRRKRMFTLL